MAKPSVDVEVTDNLLTLRISKVAAARLAEYLSTVDDWLGNMEPRNVEMSPSRFNSAGKDWETIQAVLDRMAS